MHRWHRYVAGALVAFGVSAALSGCNTRYGATLQRPSDPIVLTGAQVPGLLGADPQHVVGFAWDGSAWHQIPVQVDERAMVSPGEIYNGADPVLYGTSTVYTIPVFTPPRVLTPGYTSVATYLAPDADATFDADDELSFLANDTGEASDAPAPDGVDGASRTQLSVTDPIDGGVGYVTLFTSPTQTGGGVGTTGVQYTFSLDSGSYLSTYHMGPSAPPPNNANGPNPEHSTVTTPTYTLGFGDRWLNDSLSVHAAGASGTDLLDRTKYFATHTSCGRSEDTFDNILGYKGAFVTNVSGPVRAIRSVIGANSFGYTVLTDVFYPNRQDSTIELRGHAGMPGFGSADDLTTGLAGMTYSDPANSELPIDGVPDSFAPITATTGSPMPSAWQLVRGPAGSVVTLRRLDTSISGLQLTTTYQDGDNAGICTGDATRWGQSGFEVNSPVLNVPVTDPTLSATPASFTTSRTRYFGGPTVTAADAAQLEQRSLRPLVVAVVPAG